MKALETLHQFPPFGSPGVIERMQELTRDLAMVDSIKVVGSNGKGTTAHMLADMAMGLGKRVGLYTSPHLLKVNERIKVQGRDIADRDLNYILTWAIERASALEGCGRFEILTLAALYHFSQCELNLAIMEIGLGGRFDPVKVAPGKTSLLTSIDLEHTAILGNTVEEIAREKAAVCETGDILFSGMSGLHTAVPDGVTYVDVTEPPLSPLQNNARLAAHALQHHYSLPTLPETSGVRLMGRRHKVRQNPDIYIDVAHTPKAVQSVIDQFSDRPICLIYAGKADKQLGDLDHQFDHVIALQLEEDMARPDDILAAYQATRKETTHSLDDALLRAEKDLPEQGVILCLGSFALARGVLCQMRGIEPDPLHAKSL